MSHLIALLLAASPAVSLEVFVPLCDGSQLACGSRAAGDPAALSTNLYWGALYGAERFLSKAPGFKVVRRTDAPRPDAAHVLREVVLERAAGKGERPVTLTLLAYDGRHIDRALEDFLKAASGASSADVVVWAGHDRLMDVDAPPLGRAKQPKPVVVLACSSEQFFGPVLRRLGAPALALTRSFMAPEAYLLEALAASMAKHGPGEKRALRDALVASYARYQRISQKAAGTVFSRLE